LGAVRKAQTVQQHRILCIEDNGDTASLMLEVLEDEGFSVAIAETGLEGLDALRDRPDLVLCDIDLPDVSGLKLLEQIRTGTLLPANVPFIFVTAFAQRGYQMHARKLGCDDYITKPIDFELLVAVIRHRLASAKSQTADRADFRLTDRESEVLTWAARGKSSSGIAVILRISERTVNFHIDNAMRKLGVATRIQAAVKAAMLGLIQP
jgi:DNA-binding NarL/FixJ family response regulator